MKVSKKNYVVRHRERCGAFLERIVLMCFLGLMMTIIGQAHSFCNDDINNKYADLNRDDVKVWKLLESQRRCTPGTSLEIRARLFSGDEDEKSENFQAGGFYLLHKNIIEILRQLKLEPVEDEGDGDNNENDKRTDELLIKSSASVSSGAYLEAAARVLLTTEDHSQISDGYSSSAETFGQIFYPAITFADEANKDNEENQLLALLLYNKLAAAKSVKVEADNYGWRQNTALCTGDYFLFGYGRFGDHILVWQVPVKITPGANVVELDQYNAEIITEF